MSTDTPKPDEKLGRREIEILNDWSERERLKGDVKGMMMVQRYLNEPPKKVKQLLKLVDYKYENFMFFHHQSFALDSFFDDSYTDSEENQKNLKAVTDQMSLACKDHCVSQGVPYSIVEGMMFSGMRATALLLPYMKNNQGNMIKLGKLINLIFTGSEAKITSFDAEDLSNFFLFSSTLLSTDETQTCWQIRTHKELPTAIIEKMVNIHREHRYLYILNTPEEVIDDGYIAGAKI